MRCVTEDVKTTKSPRRVLEFAYLIGGLVLPDYAHRFSRKDFTQPQLFACLVLKEFLQLDYRKLAALLKDAAELADVIDLDKAPHFTTFHKAAKRLLLNRHAQRYLDKTIRLAQVQGRLPRQVSLAALDGTGLETRHASSYYVKRRANTGKYWQKTTYQRFPKAGILCDTRTHLVLAVVPERGPGPDIKHFRRALAEAQARVRIESLAADAGYDAEHSHCFAREAHGVRSLIPPLIGRRTGKPPSGYWRRQMKARLHLTRYSQRWQAETVNSMLKRLLGAALRARSYWSQCREILLRAITLNIMILRRGEGFYRADLSRITPIHPTYPLSDLGIDIISHQDFGRPPPRNPKPIGPPRLGLVADFTSARTIVFDPARYPLGSKTKLDYSDVADGGGPFTVTKSDSYSNLAYETRDGFFARCGPVDGTRVLTSPHFAFLQPTRRSSEEVAEQRCALTVLMPPRSHVEDGWSCNLPQRIELWTGQLDSRPSEQGPVWRMHWRRTKVVSAEGLPYQPFNAFPYEGSKALLIVSDGAVFHVPLNGDPTAPPTLVWSPQNDPVLAVVWDQDHDRGYAFTATKYFALAEKLEVKPLAEPLRPIVQPADQWPLLSRCLEVVRKQRSP